MLLLYFMLSGLINLRHEGHALRTAVPKELLMLLNNETRYNRHATPTQDTETPTVVDIQMYIEGISSFRAQSMDFQLDIYFQQRWSDLRLVHNNRRRILVKDPSVFKLMWHPDLYFANARLATFHDVTEPNFLVWIYQNGTVFYDCRISLTVICMQNFVKYPMDEQSCTLRILSYAYDVEQLNLTWAVTEKPIDMNPDIVMADMILEQIIPARHDVEYPTGTWAMTTATFLVRREIMHHILQNYVPTALIVIISWFSFWLDVDSVPGRVSLSITTLLTLSTQASAARLALPQVSYIKAIDVWMGACMAYVFAAMIEFTIVNYWSRRKVPLRLCGGLQDYYHSRFVCECSNARVRSQNTRAHQYTDPRLSEHHHRAKSFILDAENVDYKDSDLVPKYFTAYEISTRSAHGDVIEHRQVSNNSNGFPRPRSKSSQQLINETPVFRPLGSPPLRLRYTAPTLIDPMMPPAKCDACNRREEKIQNDARTRRQMSRKMAQSIDQKCRWMFPLTFILFNAIYWPFYKLYKVEK